MEAGDLGEGAEVAIAGDQGNVGVEAELCDEGIGEASAAALRENFGAECSGALPKTGLKPEQGQVREAGSDVWREVGVAQELGEDDREHKHLVALQGLF